jgi:pentatricopeptide repeat protein
MDQGVAKRKRDRRFGGPRQGPRPPGRSTSAVRVREVAAGEWELVHPRPAVDRTEDLEEVEAMMAAGEYDVAIDELRWLLSGCHDFIAAHRMLGELALLAGDVPLARGHFGIAFQLGTKAVASAAARGRLPYRLPANQAFLESGKGLITCFVRLSKPEEAAKVIEEMLRFDPSDPLGVRQMGIENGPA